MLRLARRVLFFARVSRDEAQKFQFKVTELGVELYLANQRPAVFDGFHDVSVGRFETGRSSIPILIHTNISTIWVTQGNDGQQAPGGGGGGGGVP